MVFGPDELDALHDFFVDQGFAILRGMLSDADNDEMERQCVDAQDRLIAGELADRHGTVILVDDADGTRSNSFANYVLYTEEICPAVASAVYHDTMLTFRPPSRPRAGTSGAGSGPPASTAIRPVPPLATIERVGAEMRFTYDPPDMAVEDTAMFGHSAYRMPMPLTVSIEFFMADGVYRHLWMTASPIDSGMCRAFWTVSRSDDLDGDDEPHMAFQAIVLAEDEPVVCNQIPPEMVLEAGFEISVKTDRVSIEYRRWLGQLVQAAASGPDALRAALE